MNRSVRLALATCALAVVAACGGGGAELVAPLADDDGGNVVVPGASGAAGSGNSFITTDPDASYSNNTEAAPPCGDACLGPVDAGPVCGNGVVEEGETCDDSNPRPAMVARRSVDSSRDFDCSTPGPDVRDHVMCGRLQDHRRRNVRRRQRTDGDGCSALVRSSRLRMRRTTRTNVRSRHPRCQSVVTATSTNGEQCDDRRQGRWRRLFRNVHCSSLDGIVPRRAPVSRDEYLR